MESAKKRGLCVNVGGVGSGGGVPSRVHVSKFFRRALNFFGVGQVCFGVCQIFFGVA